MSELRRRRPASSGGGSSSYSPGDHQSNNVGATSGFPTIETRNDSNGSDGSHHDSDGAHHENGGPANKVLLPATLASQTLSSTRRSSKNRLADASAIDRLFAKAAALAVAAWFLLLILVYTCSNNNSAYLSRHEREAALVAFCIMLVVTLLLILPYFVLGQRASLIPARMGGAQRGRSNVSGIVVAALSVQVVSCATNAILAFLPNVVIFDPITHAPVYMTRWCEWIPLAGLMTFLSEVIDLEKQTLVTPQQHQQQQQHQGFPFQYFQSYHKHPLFKPIVSSLAQSLSCFCGMLFPYCRNLGEWLVVMFVAISTYLCIFPRVLLRKRNLESFLHRARIRNNHHNTHDNDLHNNQNRHHQNNGKSSDDSSISSSGKSSSSGYSMAEIEEYERRRFGYALMWTCSGVWTILVVLYFLNMMAHRLLPPTHPIRLVTSLAMCCDTFFDVLAKALYMKLIVNVHKSVFDEDTRAHRQLKELRQLMSVFWEDCSDVIVISVQRNCNNSSLSSSSGAFNQSSPLGLQNEYGIPCCMYTTMISSAFPPWVMGEGDEAGVLQQSSSSSSSNKNGCLSVAKCKSACLTLEIRAPIKIKNTTNNTGNNGNDDKRQQLLAKPVVLAAYFVESCFVSSGKFEDGYLYSCDDDDIEPAIICSQDVNSLLVQEAAKISNFVWQSLDDEHDNTISINKNKTSTTMHSIQKANGEVGFCESKVSRHAGTTKNNDNDDYDIDGWDCKSLVAVVRDVTERVRRFEAEQRAHAETLARQRDAQSVNRFTRHEVKNGLLAGIELCDNLRVLVEKIYQIDDHDRANTGMDQAAASTTATTTTTLEASAVQSATEHETESTEFASTTSKAASTNETNKLAMLKSSSTATLNNASWHDSVLKGVLKQVKDLDKALHDVLDTVLTEAIARDVIHEVYRPQLIPINVEETLTGSAVGIGGTERFPLIVKDGTNADGGTKPTIPMLEMDRQLLCYIHRNAVSNACKYGKSGGIVQTVIGFDSDTNEFELQVINEVGEGHEELLSMGESANDAVFEQGKRLFLHSEGSDKHLSFGDGAWIMKKCAIALNGSCTIHFGQTQTVVTFKCPATPVKSGLGLTMFHDFEVPTGTWGIALDDSKIQRKILGRILAHVGIEKSRSIVLGETSADVGHMGTMLLSLLQADKDSKFFILVDEMLDYPSSGDNLSGSIAMKEILGKMTPDQERRVLALVRSANDAHNDIQQYCERTHGFFPKSPTQRERVREALAPLWLSRFEPKSSEEDDDAVSSREGETSDNEVDLGVSASEVLESLKAFQDRLDAMPKPLDQNSWSNIWSALHCLRGDLMMVEGNDDLSTASALIDALRGPDLPSEFHTQWDKIQATIQRGVSKWEDN